MNAAQVARRVRQDSEVAQLRGRAVEAANTARLLTSAGMDAAAADCRFLARELTREAARVRAGGA